MFAKNDMMIRHTFLLFLLPPVCLAAQPKIQLTPFATGFTRPVDITHAGDSRLFVVEQNGFIWVLDSLGVRLPGGPFLDIDARVRSTGNEQGLLGLAFHPNYATNGYFYVNYTRNTDGDTRISRFSRNAADPNKADPDSELILMEINQPFNNHNGGCIKFGPDGYLYIGMGDGGNAGDPNNYAQTKNAHLGKFLRINVNAGAGTYLVPADNPFVNDPAYLPEIWSVGWRNPWRFSFDRLTGDLERGE
jgi:glucose/arabinose dehydrogenase